MPIFDANPSPGSQIKEGRLYELITYEQMHSANLKGQWLILAGVEDTDPSVLDDTRIAVKRFYDFMPGTAGLLVATFTCISQDRQTYNGCINRKGFTTFSRQA